MNNQNPPARQYRVAIKTPYTYTPLNPKNMKHLFIPQVTHPQWQ